MAKRRRWILWILIIALFILFLAGPRGDTSFSEFLLQGFSRDASGDDALRAESMRLKGRLATLEDVQKFFPEIKEKEIAAAVYSRYFFNLKNEFVISRGGDDGVREGNAVLYPSGGVLVGKVSRVAPRYALVVTIFDPRSEFPVRIGAEGVDALLRGGIEPKLTLIDKDAELSKGDIVIGASEDLPYGIPVGEIGRVEISHEGLFKEATLVVPYETGRIHFVSVVDYVP